MKAVIAGCGRMSRAWLDAAAQIEGLQVVGLVDLVPGLAEAQARAFNLGDVAIGSDLASVLRQTAPDMVFDVVVPQARTALALTAFDHGCHLLSEKPMADTLENARTLVAAARAAGRLHAVIQNRRYIAGVRRLKRFLADGALGRIVAIHCDFFLGPHFGGFREEMAHVLLLDMAIHTFDVARLLGGGSPRSVYCEERNPAHSWYRDGASAVALFRMDDGSDFTYRGSWCAEGLQTSWEGQWRVIGERGTLLWDGHDDLRAEIVVRSGTPDPLFMPAEAVEIPPLDPRDRIGGHLGVMQDFIAALRHGTEPETVGHENIKSLAMVFGAIESARTGRRVGIDSLATQELTA